jgi:hypothetical protein
VDPSATNTAIGIEVLPAAIRNSKILSAENLTQLGVVTEIPPINPSFEGDRLKYIFQYYSINPDEMEKELHLYAKELLDDGKVDDAWQVLLALN